jgi:hypothetical protein
LLRDNLGRTLVNHLLRQRNWMEGQMSDIIGGDQTPTPEQLRKLKAMLPQLKKQAREKAQKTGGRRRTQIERMVDPVPCQVCGVVFDRYNHGKQQNDFCSSCTTNLKSGQVALVTLSGRFAFLTTPKEGLLAEILKKFSVDTQEVKVAKLAESIGGSKLHVPEDFMDRIQAKLKEN